MLQDVLIMCCLVIIVLNVCVLLLILLDFGCFYIFYVDLVYKKYFACFGSFHCDSCVVPQCRIFPSFLPCVSPSLPFPYLAFPHLPLPSPFRPFTPLLRTRSSASRHNFSVLCSGDWRGGSGDERARGGPGLIIFVLSFLSCGWNSVSITSFYFSYSCLINLFVCTVKTGKIF